MAVLHTTSEGWHFVLAEDPAAPDQEADRAAIHAMIKAFNDATSEDFRVARTSEGAPRPLDVILRRSDGEIVAGLMAQTIWGWLRIHDLWVAAPLRGQGIGSRLLRHAEDVARKRGCAHAELKTFSFQARGFYEKHGFRVIGQLDDYPPGERFYWLRKDFASAPPID
jgi:ribosomal protein S18 acetylase RimI-like enzyme